MIGKLNLLLTFNLYTTATDTLGEQIRSDAGNYADWVRVEETNGSRRLEQAGITFSKSFKVTKRHHTSRAIDPALTEIIYKSDVLSIANVKVLQDGREFYEEILCYTKV